MHLMKATNKMMKMVLAMMMMPKTMMKMKSITDKKIEKILFCFLSKQMIKFIYEFIQFFITLTQKSQILILKKESLFS